MASSTEIPLVTLLPRAWIGFSRGPWRCVGLAALVLISLVLPLLPLLALLQLTNGLLPDRCDDRPQQSWRQLLRQAFMPGAA